MRFPARLFPLTLFLCALQAGLLPAAAHAVVLRHWLWDSAQRPAYQQCARDFERAHPGGHIRIEQKGWGDYWTALSTGFVAETAPDVFANDAGHYPEQAANGVLLDLAPLMRHDQLDAGIYEDGLLESWAHRDQVWGLPADWDAVALAVNLDMTRAAGIRDDELQNMAWNPRDGGGFGRIIARLTVDQNGRDALAPDFDPKRVKVHGFQVDGPGGMRGQTQWSHFAVSAGFSFQPSPWELPLHYDAPELAATLAWLHGLAEQGVSARLDMLGKMRPEAMFSTRRVAMVPAGSWSIGEYARTVPFPYRFVPLPRGPSGERATMRGGMAHSIWSGTRHPRQAWAWTRYLGSPACQRTVAAYGVVYPAVRGAWAASVAAQRERGVEPAAFIEMAQARAFPPPIVPHARQVDDLFETTIAAILLGELPASQALAEANLKANALFADAAP